MISNLNKLLLAYSLLPGIGSVKLHKLISATGLVELPCSSVLKSCLSFQNSSLIADYLNGHGALYTKVSNSSCCMDQCGVSMLNYLQADYPKLLKETPDFPVFIFCKGDLRVLNRPQIAIVGSRKASRSSLRTAYKFAKELSGLGFVITSGLAHGIDSAAHSGAVDNSGASIAVMGTGLDNVYPRQHQSLANSLLDNGCWVSEYMFGVKPLASNFPKRNRIISGLSVATIVVEARKNSGTLITARMALEQNREVFAVPGPIEYEGSSGPHMLIKQGAALVENTQDIVNEINPQLLDNGNAQSFNNNKALDEEPHYLLDVIGYDLISLEELVLLSGVKAIELSVILVELELDGAIESIADRYRRI